MKKKTAVTIFLILIFLLSACYIPGVLPPPTQDTSGGNQPPPGGDTSNNGGALPTITNTFEPTLTATLGVPMVSVSTATFCRTGPGTEYDKVTTLEVGEEAEVVGKAPYGGSWIIKNPHGSGTCWLWDQYATVVGDTAALPVIDVPPTPTPSPSFTVSYQSLVTCASWFVLRFQLTNNGGVTWESYKINVTDTVTTETKSYVDDEFLDADPTCFLTTTLQDLTPGETGYTGNWYGGSLSASPVGHNVNVTFTLCSQNGLAGLCISKSLSVTP